MSGAAVDWADTFTHPRVTDAAHEVLTAIARCIPEGETTTPLIGMGAIAREARVDRRTVWTWLPVLVDIGVVRVVDGGQGRKARYTLIHVDGIATPIAVPLPLRADLQAVPPRTPVALPLFDDPPIGRSEREELVIPITSGVARTITRITSWVLATITRITRITRITSWGPIVRTAGEELVIRTCDPCDPPRALDAVLTTARDVHTFKEVHTPAAPQDGPPERVAPAPRRHPWHAWCGRVVCVPQDLHDDWRRKGHEAAWLFAFYARREAAIAVDEKILVNDFTFWRTAFKAELARVTPKSRAPGLGPPGFDTPCPHQPTCDDPAACIDRTMAEWQPKKEQSG